MTSFEFYMTKELIKDDLRIDVSSGEKSLEVVWTGKTFDRNPGEFLHPFLNEILTEAKANGLEIRLDFYALEYLNSSTITPVIRLLEEAKNQEVPVTLLYSRNKVWQDKSFSAMKFFESKEPRIVIEPR